MLSYGRGHSTADGSQAPLQITNLRVQHAGASAAVIERLDLTVARGERVAIVGPNGSGKSTLLKAVCGLVPLQAGDVQVFGQPLRACRQCVAYLAQRSEIDWRFPIPVLDLVVAGRYVHLGWLRRPTRGDRERALTMLDQLGMAQFAYQTIGDLSGGQQQRVLLARALVQDADLLLLDEPLTAVDSPTRDVIAAALHALQRAGKTIVVATHHVDRMDAEFDRVVVLREGAIVVDQPAGLYAVQHAAGERYELVA